MRIGSIDAATNKVTWLNANDIKFPGRFLYSCLTQVDGTQDVIFNQFSLLDLLGEGWSYSAATPALAVSNMVEALDVDEEIELSAAGRRRPRPPAQFHLQQRGDAGYVR